MDWLWLWTLVVKLEAHHIASSLVTTRREKGLLFAIVAPGKILIDVACVTKAYNTTLGARPFDHFIQHYYCK